MKPTQKFTNKFLALHPKEKLQDVINGVVKQQINFPTPQLEHPTVLYQKVDSVILWAFNRVNTNVNINSN